MKYVFSLFNFLIYFIHKMTELADTTEDNDFKQLSERIGFIKFLEFDPTECCGAFLPEG